MSVYRVSKSSHLPKPCAEIVCLVRCTHHTVEMFRNCEGMIDKSCGFVGKLNSKGGALTQRTAGRNLATVRLDNRTHNR